MLFVAVARSIGHYNPAPKMAFRAARRHDGVADGPHLQRLNKNWKQITVQLHFKACSPLPLVVFYTKTQQQPISENLDLPALFSSAKNCFQKV